MRTGLNTRLNPVESHEDGCVIIPFGFTINGTSDPDNLIGDWLESVVRSEAGEFLCTLKSKVARCFYGAAGVSVTVDDTPMECEVDWSTVKSAGTFVVRTFGGAIGSLASGALTGTVTNGHSDVVGADATLTSTALTGTLTDLTVTGVRIEADPTNDLLVGGYLLVSKTTREAR